MVAPMDNLTTTSHLPLEHPLVNRSELRPPRFDRDLCSSFLPFLNHTSSLHPALLQVWCLQVCNVLPNTHTWADVCNEVANRMPTMTEDLTMELTIALSPRMMMP